MNLGPTILMSLVTGVLLSAFAHFCALVPAIALILLAHVAKGLIEHDALLSLLSAVAALIALEMGFVLGSMLRSVSPPGKRHEMAIVPSNEKAATWSPIAGDESGAPRRNRLRINSHMRPRRDRRDAIARSRGLCVARNVPRPAGP
jgi:hypothetical protein